MTVVIGSSAGVVLSGITSGVYSVVEGVGVSGSSGKKHHIILIPCIGSL